MLWFDNPGLCSTSFEVTETLFYISMPFSNQFNLINTANKPRPTWEAPPQAMVTTDKQGADEAWSKLGEHVNVWLVSWTELSWAGFSAR